MALVSVEPEAQARSSIGPDGGWGESAKAWIDAVEKDAARLALLDPIMLRLAGDVAGARTLDVGCGEGRFSRMLVNRGARATGIDPTDLLVRAASARGFIAPLRGVAEALPFVAKAFDLVVTYITLVDIEHYREAIAEMARVLKPGGRLLAANISFVSASQAENGGWRRDEAGERIYVPIDHYAEETSAVYEWAGLRLRNYHRPLSGYMRAYLGAGLLLREFLEPVPDERWRSVPEYSGAFRVPWFNVMLWERPT
jgi:ubiquinone/menaquinone biosynthesis C-methylase UbiE